MARTVERMTEREKELQDEEMSQNSVLGRVNTKIRRTTELETKTNRNNFDLKTTANKVNVAN